MVKQEILPGGKKPRMIINAGDLHQLSALLVVSCFEHFWYPKVATDHIKKAAKLPAMHRIVGNLGLAATSDPETVEGDGSSWDFCQSLKIRELIENPILRHISHCLYEESAWTQLPFKVAMVSLDFRRVEMWTVRPSGGVIDFKMGKRHKLKCSAVRPSGERGTSCLNHLVNCVMWACVLLENPHEIFDSIDRDSHKSRTYKLRLKLFEPLWPRAPGTQGPEGDSDDRKEWKAKMMAKQPRVAYRGVFEGDDSLVVTDKWVWDCLDKEIRLTWFKAGFDMKIIRQSDPSKRGSVTFTGYEFLCHDGLPTLVMCPSIPRNIMNSAFTVSTYALKPDSDEGNFCGKPRVVRSHEVGAQAMFARAAAYMPHLPWLANFFTAQAEYHQNRLISLGHATVDKLDTTDWSTAHKLGVSIGEAVSIGDVLENAQNMYRPCLEPLYDDLVYRTTGYVPTVTDKVGLTSLYELDPHDEFIARGKLPPALYGAASAAAAA